MSDYEDEAELKAAAFEGGDHLNRRGGGGAAAAASGRGRGGRQPTAASASAPAAPAAPPAPSTSDSSSSERFLTVEQALDRVRWDQARFHPDDVMVGYEDRFSDKLMFTTVTNFRASNDVTIPLHRVQQLVHKGQVIYDRPQRINLLGDAAPVRSVETAAAPPARRARTEVSSTSILKHIKGVALEVIPPTAPLPLSVLEDKTPSQIKVLNFNLLHDLFDAEMIFTEERLPLIRGLLESVDPDIAFLQEGTPKFMNYLRDSSPMLCARYFWTTIPSDSQTIQITLSKFPIAAATSHALSRNKRCVFAAHQVSSDVCIVSANCHLLSDFGTDPVNRRLGELATILEHLIKAQTVSGARLIMSGDFNFGDQNPEQRTADWKDFADSWLEVQGLDQRFDPSATVVCANEIPTELSRVGGFTYDLNANWLADSQSRAHRYPRRLDRTLLRGLQPLQCVIVGNKPVATPLGDTIRPLFPSDHFGLLTTCDFDATYIPKANAVKAVAPKFVPPPPWFNASPALSSAVDKLVKTAFKPFFRTALVVLIPDQFVPLMNELRQRYDKAYPRWMPHVTLMFPFVEPERFGEAIAAIENAISIAPPTALPAAFNLSLHKPGAFEAKKCVMFLEPMDPTTGAASRELALLNYFLQPLFPTLAREDRDGDFHPHATLGQCAQQQMRKILQDFSAKWANVFPTPASTVFTVSQFALIAHLDGRDGFEVIHKFNLPGICLAPAE